MIQVKEFDDDDYRKVDDKINEWIKENYNSIKIKDIKYQVCMNNHVMFTKVLVIYETVY